MDSRVAAIAAAVAELYRVRGFARAEVKPEITVLPGSRGDGDGSVARPVGVRLVVTEGSPTIVGDVAIQGASAIGEARLRASCSG